MAVVHINYDNGDSDFDAYERFEEVATQRFGDGPNVKPSYTREPEEALATALRRTAQAADLDLGKIIAHLSTNNKEN